jgi:hypothetical protein
VVELDDISTQFSPNASSNQFEQALAEFGELLGFAAERPEKYGKGPDVLWLLTPKLGLVLEAKSRKNEDNPLSKEEYGQLLTSLEWFKHHYPEARGVGAVVAPNKKLSERSVANEAMVLTLARLAELTVSARQLLEALCQASSLHRTALIQRAEQLLAKHQLKPESLIQRFLAPLETASS